MRNNLDIRNFQRILFLLEIKEERFLNLLESSSPQLALERLEDLKRTARKKRRILAKKFHPDLVADNKEKERRIKKMKEVNNLVDMILKLQIQFEVPRPAVHVQILRTYGSSDSSDTFNTSSTTTIFGGFGEIYSAINR